MHKTKSGTTRTKLPKKATLLRMEGVDPSILYVIDQTTDTNVKIRALKETGGIIPLTIQHEIFDILWVKSSVLVNDKKEKTIAFLKGLI